MIRGVLLAAIVAGVVAWLALSLLDRMIFFPDAGADLRPGDVGLEGEDVFLETDDGVRVHAFWLPAGGASRALLFLHGNAGNASHRLPNAAELVRLGIHVLLADYRGYGLSGGSPSERGVYADARAALDHLVRVRGLPESRIVVFGRSLGSAVAVDVARDRELAGLILESSFTSAADVARNMIGPLAVITGRRFDSARKIRAVRCPILFFHGDRDAIVPFELGYRLYEAAPEPKSFETLVGAGHNDTIEVGGAAYFERIRLFLDEVVPPERG